MSRFSRTFLWFISDSSHTTVSLTERCYISTSQGDESRRQVKETSLNTWEQKQLLTAIWGRKCPAGRTFLLSDLMIRSCFGFFKLNSDLVSKWLHLTETLRPVFIFTYKLHSFLNLTRQLSVIRSEKSQLKIINNSKLSR